MTPPSTPMPEQVKIEGRLYHQADLTCPECRGRMKLRAGPIRASGGHVYYACERYPDCRGSHGAHPGGQPLGTPATSKDKTLRIAAHAEFDPLWREGHFSSRGAAYRWMQEVMGMTPAEAHIGNFDAPTCSRLIRKIWDFTGE